MNSTTKQPPRARDFWISLGPGHGCAVLPGPDGYTLTFKYKPEGAAHYVRGNSAFLPRYVFEGILSHVEKAGMQDEERSHDQKADDLRPNFSDNTPSRGSGANSVKSPQTATGPGARQGAEGLALENSRFSSAPIPSKRPEPCQ